MTIPNDEAARALGAELKALASAATPGPWCWEQCGEKCDAPVVGVAYHPNDHDREHPISGELESTNELGQEIDFYRESIAADISACDGCSASANAALIARIHSAIALAEYWEARATELQARLAEYDCKHCGGSGEIEVMTSHLGPDDYTETVNCPRCGGTATTPPADGAVRVAGRGMTTTEKESRDDRMRTQSAEFDAACNLSTAYRNLPAVGSTNRVRSMATRSMLRPSLRRNTTGLIR